MSKHKSDTPVDDRPLVRHTCGREIASGAAVAACPACSPGKRRAPGKRRRGLAPGFRTTEAQQVTR